MGRFEGKVVIVTGASSGIGAATAIAFAKEGARLTVHGKNSERLRKEAKRCRDLGTEVMEIASDLSEFKNLEIIISKTVEKYSSIDILVNCAGFKTIEEVSKLDSEEFDKLFSINLRAPIFLSKYALPYLKKSKGCVINVSSTGSFEIYPSALTYCMTKNALDHFTRGFAAECASFGVRVNSINPGVVDTKMMNPDRMEPGTAKPIHKQIWDMVNADTVQPLGIIQPDVIAESILFLCSSVQITGTVFVVDGGILLSK